MTPPIPSAVLQRAIAPTPVRPMPAPVPATPPPVTPVSPPPILQSLPEVLFTDAVIPMTPIGMAEIVRGLPPEVRAAVGDQLLMEQLMEVAKSNNLPPDRIAEIMPHLRSGGQYDPAKILGSYADLLTPEEMDTRFRQLLLQHPELRADFFGETLRANLGRGMPHLGTSIAGLLGFEKMADLLGIRDPSVRFAFVIGGTHALQPLFAATGDVARTAYRQLARGKFITYAAATKQQGMTIFTRGNPLGNTLWQITKGHLGFEGATLAQRLGAVFRGVGHCAASPLGMGRDLLWSQLWTALVGGSSTRTVDGIEIPTVNRTAHVVGFLGFFTESVLNMFSNNAYAMWINGPSIGASLARGAGWTAGVGFAADLSALFGNWMNFGDGSRAAGAQQFRIGEIVFGSSDNPLANGPLGFLRWAGLGRGFIDHFAASGNGLTADVLQLLSFRGAPEHVEWSASYIADLVRRQDAGRIGQLAEEFRTLLWTVLTWGDAAAAQLKAEDGGAGLTFDQLAAQYRGGFLERVEVPALLRGYATRHDGAISYYNLVRAFESLRQYPLAATIADFFDEDFREHTLGSDDLKPGMRVLAEGGWKRLIGYIAGTAGTEAILVQRNINFYRQAIVADLTFAAAQFEAQHRPSPQSAMTLAHAATTQRQWTDLARDVHRLDAHGNIQADAEYYRALGEVTRTIALSGEAGEREVVQRWLRHRMTQLLDPKLPATVRLRLVTELKVANPNIFFGYQSREARQAAELMSLAKAVPAGQPRPIFSLDFGRGVRGGAHLELLHPDFDGKAQAALKDAADFWVEKATYDLSLDVHAQAATLGGGFPDDHTLSLATLRTHAALGAQRNLDRVTDRVTMLEGRQLEGDLGSDAARLSFMERNQRVHALVADLEQTRLEHATLLKTDASRRHAALGDTNRFFHYAADAARWSPVPVPLPAGIDPATGDPATWGTYVRTLVTPALKSSARDEAQLSLLEQKPGNFYPDPFTPYRTAKLRQYHATAAEIGETMARWVTEAKVLGQPPQTYIDRQLASPAGWHTRKRMQQQIVREKLAEFAWKPGYHAATMFGEHGTVIHYPDLLDSVTRTSPHLHHELSARVFNILGAWYGEAIAHGIEEESTVATMLTSRLNTPAARPVRQLIAELVGVEAAPGRHPQWGAFALDEQTGKVTIDWSALKPALTMGGMQPDRAATTPSYLQTSVRQQIENIDQMLQVGERAFAAADATEQAVVGDQLAPLRATRDRLQAWLDRPAKMAMLYQAHTRFLEDQFVTLWNAATRDGASDASSRRARIGAYLKTPAAALLVMTMRQQLELQHRHDVAGRARDIYNAQGEIIDWDRFDAWIRTTGRLTPVTLPPEFDYVRPGFKM